MSNRQPRWELVRTAAGWHARFRSSNGNVIVSSEVYKKRASAQRAVELVTRGEMWSKHVTYGSLVQPVVGTSWFEVDER